MDIATNKLDRTPTRNFIHLACNLVFIQWITYITNPIFNTEFFISIVEQLYTYILQSMWVGQYIHIGWMDSPPKFYQVTTTLSAHGSRIKLRPKQTIW